MVRLHPNPDSHSGTVSRSIKKEEDQKNMSKLAYVLLIIAGIGDAITTEIGIRKGLPETRPYANPVLSTSVLCAATYAIDKLAKKTPRIIPAIIKASLVILAFTPTISNTYMLTKEQK